MTEVSRAATFFSAAINSSGLTQKEIARRAGFSRPNVISMMKSGETKIPIPRVPGLAVACGIPKHRLLEVVLSEEHPEIWEVISDMVCFDP
ncbi:helix-turn-helix transcriptional regulator [Sedimentitalea sp.]|uniref:helix-turn-helix domain-containing protein n=1 Tax=Sedimentitalea sp. TaxID=2048915 RepID=UPI003298AED7